MLWGVISANEEQAPLEASIEGCRWLMECVWMMGCV